MSEPVASSPVNALDGPYDAIAYGKCECHGGPVNSSGRCAPLNATPEAVTQRAYLIEVERAEQDQAVDVPAGPLALES